MSKTIAFIQIHGLPGIIEVDLSTASTVGEFRDALAAAGIIVDTETFIFIDEAEEHVGGERHDPIHGLKHGCRIHVSRCKRIKTTVQCLEKTDEREFPPGTRVRAVKEWAVRKFELKPTDAAEHVLQICNSTERPASDTPLHQLIVGHGDQHGQRHEHHCVLCFDLVPDKRVEG